MRKKQARVRMPTILTPGAILVLAVWAAACVRPREIVRIDGSPGVAPLVAALVSEYRRENPSATVDVGAGLGSSARIQALADGKIDVAMASHGVVPAELQRRGLAAHEIARTA